MNTRHFQLNIIRAAQEKIEVLTSDRNKALIETFRENSRRQTLLLQTRDKLTGACGHCDGRRGSECQNRGD